MKEFIPHWALRNGHLMTIAAAFLRRKFPRLPAGEPRLFEVEPASAEGRPGAQVRGDCHWQKAPREHPTLVLLHGLEGSSESAYMMGTAEKAWATGFNVVRLNQRNCGGTEHLSPTLYHSGLSGDIRAVLLELIERDRLPDLFAAGFSMGGNLVLKMAGEFGDRGAGADSRICGGGSGFRSGGVRRRAGRAAQFHLRDAFRAAAEGTHAAQGHAVSGADFRWTAWEASAACAISMTLSLRAFAVLRGGGLLRAIERAAVGWGNSQADADLAAGDDPFVPVETFTDAALRANPEITLLAPAHGGHCAFISCEAGRRVLGRGANCGVLQATVGRLQALTDRAGKSWCKSSTLVKGARMGLSPSHGKPSV